jgi:DNA-binding transcriptional ArsR family regulator
VSTKREVLTGNLLESVAGRLWLLGEPVRLQLLQELEGGGRSVNALADAIGGGQPNISRHLTALFNGGLPARRRQGVKTYYSIADPLVFRLCDLMCRSAVKHIRIRLEATVRDSRS